MRPVVIYGPPCSGKSTYAHDQMCDADVIFDYDKLIKALSTREHPEVEKNNAHDIALAFRRRFCEKNPGSAGNLHSLYFDTLAKPLSDGRFARL